MTDEFAVKCKKVQAEVELTKFDEVRVDAVHKQQLKDVEDAMIAHSKK